MNLVQHFTILDDLTRCTDEIAIGRKRWISLQSRPNMRDGGQVLWQDLNTALGHESSLSTRGRSPNSAQTQAFSWLAASNNDHLVVLSANFLTPHQLHDLCSMTSALGIQIWLIYDLEPSDDRLVALRRLSPTRCNLDEFLQVRAQSAIEKLESKKWVTEFAGSISEDVFTYDELMADARNFLHTGRYSRLSFDTPDEFYSERMVEFWAHFERITGLDASERGGDNFYSCSC